MNIPIPQFLINAWVAFGDRANIAVWRFGRYEVLRIDILLVILFLFCTGFYWALYDWRGAIGGGVSFIVIAMFSLFARRGFPHPRDRFDMDVEDDA